MNNHEDGDEDLQVVYPAVGGVPAGVTDWAALGVKPPPLRPLRYCDFRNDDGMCLRFSSLELDTMSFCTYHHHEVTMALAEEERRIS